MGMGSVFQAGVGMTDGSLSIVDLLWCIAFVATFGIGAALAMNIEDIYVQQRRTWFRLHEKGGKEHHVPVALFFSTSLMPAE